MKEYLGDSLYAKVDGDVLILTTEQGDGYASNMIVIDRYMLKSLLDFISINFVCNVNRSTGNDRSDS